jgi:hypothetical protein
MSCAPSFLSEQIYAAAAHFHNAKVHIPPWTICAGLGHFKKTPPAPTPTIGIFTQPFETFAHFG